MTWEQKLLAIQALGEVALYFRGPGDWLLHQRAVMIGGDGFLSGLGANVGNSTPEAAVEKYWTAITSIPLTKYIQIGHDDGQRYRWNGFMWAKVVE